MSRRKKREIPDEARQLAFMAAEELKRCLSPADGSLPDSKAAKDFSSIMKDMAALARDNGSGRSVTVEFSPETEALAK